MTPIHALLILSILAQNPLTTLPRNYRLVWQNDYVSVIHVRYEPHQKLAVHDHPKTPTVYVYLTDSGPVQFNHVEDHGAALVRPALKAGAFRVSPGRIEKHTVENLGDIPTEFLRVELLQVPLGLRAHSLRGDQPFDLRRSGATTVFPGPPVRIDRVTAAATQSVDLSSGDDPSLLIAITPATIANSTLLKSGDVRWLPAHGKQNIAGYGAQPAHLLRIFFLPRHAGQ